MPKGTRRTPRIRTPLGGTNATKPFGTGTNLSARGVGTGPIGASVQRMRGIRRAKGQPLRGIDDGIALAARRAADREKIAANRVPNIRRPNLKRKKR